LQNANFLKNGYGYNDESLVLWNDNYILSNTNHCEFINVYNLEEEKKETEINLNNGKVYWIDKAINSTTLIALYRNNALKIEEVD